MAEVRPVHLRLLTGKHLELQECLAPLWTQAGNGAAQLHDASDVAAIPNHVIDAGRAQLGVLLQSQANEPDVGIGDRGAQRLRAFEALTLDGVAHGVWVDAQLCGNGADLPMLGVKVTSNLRADFVGDHEESHLRRGMRGNGSMKRPIRPRMQQRSLATGADCGGGIVFTAAAAPDVPYANNAGEVIEREP